MALTPGAARWLSRAAGLIAVALGVLLLLRPVASLDLIVLITAIGLLCLAVGEVMGERSRWSSVRAVAWLAGAAIVLVWPDLGVRGLAITLGVTLLVDGGVAIIAERRRVIGAASVILGLLALSWPDVTVIVISALFAVRLLRFGLGPFLGRSLGRVLPRHAAPWWDRIRPGAALAGALLLLGISLLFHVDKPRPDSFYDAPTQVPSAAGELIRVEPFTRAVPKGAQAWRILYTTTRDDGDPAIASAIVLVPTATGSGTATGTGTGTLSKPFPVIAWAHGTTGFVEGCAPSVLRDPWTAGATPPWIRS